MDITKKKVVVIDLDDTLIHTRTNNKFPQGVWDMKLDLDVFAQLKKLRPLAVLVASNQGGIELGLVNKQLFEAKFIYIIASLQEYIGLNTLVSGNYCLSNDPTNEFRKPNPGMYNMLVKQFEEQFRVDIENSEVLAIGDASGLPGDFSDSDLKAAQNFGCDYIDVREFVKLELPEPLFKIIERSTLKVVTEGDTTLENMLEEDAKKAVERLNAEHEIVMRVPQLWVAPKPIQVQPKETKGRGRTVKMKPSKK